MIHTFNFRVYYEDTDAGGIVYHANYLKFAERARTEFLHKIGLSNQKLLKKNMAFVVSKIEIDYKRPAVLEDNLTVETSIMKMGAATMLLRQDIKRQEEVISNLKVSVAVVSLSEKRPVRLPEEFREKFEKFI